MFVKQLVLERVALMKAAIYLRVSTDGQTVENQRRELLAAAARHGWEVVQEFCDEGISGAKGRDRRPGLDRLMRTLGRREVDILMAWSVDRLGRSLQDLVALLGELQAKRVDLYLHQQGLDTSTPAGKAMFGMLGVFAEFERALVQERVRAGLQRARVQGKRLGRPPVPADVVAAARASHAAGKGMRRIAADLGIGVGTVHRLVKVSSPPTAIGAGPKERDQVCGGD
jgi:DNA invertase Pin-like site-specific DNA recombinase